MKKIAKPKQTELTDLEKQFKEEICDRGEEVDPEEELDWHALSIGWALAKGMSVDDAYSFATKVRYQYEYWQ